MVILGLGSNIGDRLAHLEAAVRALAPVMRGLRASRVLESRAVLPAGAPPAWDLPYLNMAVCGDTTLAPLDLLNWLKAIESRAGRVSRGIWGPREIDLDILVMDEVVMASAGLTIPHPELLNRDFALLPCVDVAPDFIYPHGVYKGKRVLDIVREKNVALGEHLKDTGMRVHV